MERITSPARRVLEKCGNGDFSKGCEFVAQCTGLKVNGVLRWTYSREKGGAGGLIPALAERNGPGHPARTADCPEV